MNESANSEGTSIEPEKPVLTPSATDVKFPPFPVPTDDDFDEDIGEEERNYYKSKFPDLNAVKTFKLHCTACDRHLGCSAKNENRMRSHPMLRTLVCHTCHTFYNSGEFDKGDDGSELYCRWCGQGGQVYCCADCPHVFCAKCIKRNLGTTKIKEIEDADDWKCFKCNSKCLWDLRALCWALLRYCDLKNKTAYVTQDPELKEAYQKDCAIDDSECCKRRAKRKSDVKKREDKKEPDTNKTAVSVISKIPSTIQVKKFASINATADDLKPDLKPEKKAVKRPASPKPRPMYMKTPVPAVPPPKLLASPIAMPSMPSLPKKMRMPNSVAPLIRLKPVREPPNATYARIRPKMGQMPHMPQMPIAIMNNQFNGFNNSKIYHNTNTFNNTYGNMAINDNINLSLESLTQGLDMAAVAALANNNSAQDDDVVCTPDFPLEPVCEVTEDNTDDDVQCMTPGPVVPPKIRTPPPASSALPSSTRALLNTLPDPTADNIIQMTENDVTVNAATGGLKFRVDPQTLSSNKMYRLPDGRIFAINANPAMPGGYSATIVAVAETAPGKVAPKGPTYAAKLSAITTTSSSSTSTKTPRPNNRLSGKRTTSKPSTTKTPRATKTKQAATRECDLNVSVEWYRYNLIDAVDALEYSLSRLHKLKKETTSVFLRTRSIQEMKNLHKSLDRLLSTSSTRFNEIRDNLSKELKQYLIKKMSDNTSEKMGDNISEDDDVEILNDDDNDDPIFIDENSVDSNINETNCNERQQVDLTVASSEHNDSGENNIDNSKMDVDLPIAERENPDEKENSVEKEDNEMDSLDAAESENPDKENDGTVNISPKSVLKQSLGYTSVQKEQNKEEEHIESSKESDEIPNEKKSDNAEYEENSDMSDLLKCNEDLLPSVNNGVNDESNDAFNEDVNKDDAKGENYDKEENDVAEEGTADLNHKVKVDEDKRDEEKVDKEDKVKLDKEDEEKVDKEDEEKVDKEGEEKVHEEIEDGEKEDEELVDEEKTLLNEQTDSDIIKESDEKVQDTEMSDEMIETLLRDDTTTSKMEDIIGI